MKFKPSEYYEIKIYQMASLIEILNLCLIFYYLIDIIFSHQCITSHVLTTYSTRTINRMIIYDVVLKTIGLIVAALNYNTIAILIIYVDVLDWKYENRLYLVQKYL